jgi:hypothetical protein
MSYLLKPKDVDLFLVRSNTLNTTQSNPWAEVKRLQAENERLTVEAEALKSQRGISSLLAADRTQRERELIEENSRLREANRRLQTEGPALERDKLIVQLRGELSRKSQLLNLALGGWRRNFALRAATEESYAQVQRESAELRTKYETHCGYWDGPLMKIARAAVGDAILRRAMNHLHRLHSHDELADVRKILIDSMNRAVVEFEQCVDDYRLLTEPVGPCKYEFDEPEPLPGPGEPCPHGGLEITCEGLRQESGQLSPGKQAAFESAIELLADEKALEEMLWCKCGHSSNFHGLPKGCRAPDCRCWSFRPKYIKTMHETN